MRNDTAGDSLADEGGADLVNRLLGARGLVDDESKAQFRSPSLHHLHPPELMPGVDMAAVRLIEAINRGEKIVIYGDYDVDGITATAILYHTIRKLDESARLETYVPHRLEEGYGLNGDALRQLRSDGADVVVSVDCGITAVEPAMIAREVGLDLIITDHHTLPSDVCNMPDAVALVHPALPGSEYPFPELCGAGVAFKLAWHLARKWAGSERVGAELQKTLMNLLPLAALGTIADVMPLIGENRIITSFGLRLIKETPIIGLRALMEATNLAGENIDSHKVGFILAPHLNACGRMGHAAEAVQLLTDAAQTKATEIAQTLAKMNRERRSIQKTITDQALRMAEDRGMTVENNRAIILTDENWHPGVLGIACSRLVDQYNRPTILLNRNEDICKGSARSIDSYSIIKAIESCSEHLITFGGHDMAAGLTLETKNLGAFTEAIIEHANRHINVEQLTPVLTIDCVASLNEMNMQVVRDIVDLSPFGRGNPRPIVCIENVRITAKPRQMGSGGKHLLLQIAEDHEGKRTSLRTVWWSEGKLAAEFAPGMHVDMVIEPKINSWNGRVNVEGIIHDARLRKSE